MGFLGRAVGGRRAPGGKFVGAPRAPRAWREGAPSLRRVPFVYKPAGRRAGRPPLPARPAPLPAPRPPLPAPGPRPSGAARSSRAHLLHAPPPASALPAGREPPYSSPYFPRCNLSFLFMDVGLLFFFFSFNGWEGTWHPGRGSIYRESRRPSSPFFPDPTFLSLLNSPGSWAA